MLAAWLIAGLVVPSVVAVDCEPVVQHAALIDLWTATGGPAWNDIWQWPVDEANHCLWRGVTCEEQCVVELRLSDFLSSPGLQGTLPDIWGALATLRWLDLGGPDLGRAIVGPLPASFEQLQSLSVLALDRNAMTGPLDLLLELPVLEEVYLWQNEFSGGLVAFDQPVLRVLELANNLLDGPIPSALGSLRLDNLDVSNCRLSSTIPPELGELARSALIDLSGNVDLVGVLPHTLAGRGGNLKLSGTQVTVGCPPGFLYNSTLFDCVETCDPGYSTPAEAYADTCAACGPGSATTGAGSACELCAAGTFSNATANTECTPCPEGQRNLPGASACGECPAGTGPSATVDGACVICEAGTASPGGAVECTVCPAGTAAGFAAGECTRCGPGRFSLAPESVTCQECPAGTFSGGVANTGCSPCAAGTVSQAGAGACTRCGPGLFSPAPRREACIECSLGTFAGGAVNTECTPCASGLAAPEPGSAACEPCGAGSISLNNGASCSACPAGSSTDGVATATSCTPCPVGTIAPEQFTPSCEACAAGTTSNALGTACEACPAGTSTEGANGAPSCLPCPAGSASDPGSATCEPCESGTFSDEPGRIMCSPCPAGSTTEGATGALSCVACPAGSSAPAGNVTCSLCAPGSFATAGGQPECTVCPAGTHQTLAGAAAACPACRYPGRCREGNECAAGYSGAGCLFCAVDHFRLNNVCLSCPVIPWPLIVLLVLGAALLRAASKNRLGARQTTVLKIVLFYVQMVVVALALQVEWPSTQTGFVEAMSFASAEIGLPLAECYVSVGWYAGFAGSLAGPVAVILVFWMATMVVEWRRRRAWAKTGDATQDFALMGRASNMRRLWIAASAMMHLPLVRVLLGAFDCERDSNGDLVVAGSDDGTPCNSSTHVAVQSLSGFALAMIGLIFPLLVVWFTLRLRRTDQLDAGVVQAAWGALYESYCPQYCFLEGVVAMRKVLVTLTLVVPGIPAGWRSVLLLVQSVGWGTFVLVQRPYVRVRGRVVFGLFRRADVINELEAVMSLVVVLHQGTAGLAVVSNGGRVSLAAGVVLLIITVGVLVAALWQAARIGRGFEVAPTRFSQVKAVRDQRTLLWAYSRAIARKDYEEAAQIRTEGVRHARQTREFAEWRTDHNKVSTNDVPFLEMLIAEETTSRAELEMAIGETEAEEELLVLLDRATAAGYFDLVKMTNERLDEVEEDPHAGGRSWQGPIRAFPEMEPTSSSWSGPVRIKGSPRAALSSGTITTTPPRRLTPMGPGSVSTPALRQ